MEKAQTAEVTLKGDPALDLLLSAQENMDPRFLSEISLWTNYQEN